MAKQQLSRKQQANADPGQPERPWGKRLVDATQTPMTLKEQIQRYVRMEVSHKAQDDGFETFEEADDFEDEEPEPPWVSEYEIPDTKEEDRNDLDGHNDFLEHALTESEDPPEQEVEQQEQEND